MTQPRTPRSPRAAAAKLRAVPTAAAGQTTARVDGWDLDRQVAFLRALSATHSVTEAAQSVGRSRQSAYRLRSRLKGGPFDLAWEVAFHHSFDVLAHAALERALNGVERPVFYQGEQVGSYRRFDEGLTVALLRSQTLRGNPAFGRLKPMAERHARDFESLLAKLQAGEAVETGALSPEDPDEFGHRDSAFARDSFCPSGWSDEQLMQALQENGWRGESDAV
ncbi:hypothetical protein GVM20_15940 [Porphyrobacter sp. SLTP]|uniref:hypothetical protein n=1 Tax=Porphyrobacter sp. SLTP TaxID=2683266 RepID=UPI001411C65E|nr:hypothetical protein [Porphyrobacter sp. SLTP]NBB26622.1 hypothetical protein [Porphyrobacter sp. SLTP]